jgi:hypothetical protein
MTVFAGRITEEDLVDFFEAAGAADEWTALTDVVDPENPGGRIARGTEVKFFHPLRERYPEYFVRAGDPFPSWAIELWEEAERDRRARRYEPEPEPAVEPEPGRVRATRTVFAALHLIRAGDELGTDDPIVTRIPDAFTPIEGD